MKLVLAIISNSDQSRVRKNLLKERFYVTKLSSSGGFLQSGNTTFLIGCRIDKVDRVIEIISEYCKTRQEIIPSGIANDMPMFANAVEVTVGGATIFIIDVEKFVKV